MKNHVENQLKLQLPNLASSTFIVKATIEAFLKQSDANVYEINDIKVATEEAVENCIYHAYPEGSGIIYVNASLRDKVVRIAVYDKGVGILNVKQAKLPLFSTLENHSGMGITIMESLMDEVNVRSILGKGTVVIMKMKLSGK